MKGKPKSRKGWWASFARYIAAKVFWKELGRNFLDWKVGIVMSLDGIEMPYDKEYYNPIRISLVLKDSKRAGTGVIFASPQIGTL